MTPYYLFFLIQISTLVLARFLNKKNSLGVLSFLILVGVLFAGLRGNIGTDTFMYRTMYSDVWAGRDTSNYEPGFRWLATILGHVFGDNTQIFIFSISAIQGLVLLKVLQLLKERDVYYFIFTSTFYVNLQFNQVRVGVAVLLINYALLLSLRRRQKLSGGGTAITALLTHVTVAPLAVLLASRRPWIIVPIIIGTIVAIPFIAMKITGGANAGGGINDDFRIGIGFVLTVALLGGIIAAEPLQFRSRLTIVVLFGAYALFGLLSGKWLLASRVAMIFEGGLYVLLLADKRSIRMRTVLFTIAVYHVYGSLSFIKNSDEAMRDLIAKYPGYAAGYEKTHWIPYEFYWNDDSGVK